MDQHKQINQTLSTQPPLRQVKRGHSRSQLSFELKALLTTRYALKDRQGSNDLYLSTFLLFYYRCELLLINKYSVCDFINIDFVIKFLPRMYLF